MKYKTRSQIPPQGKPNVYFCCHPDDLEKYFECISDDILSKQNCVIWYLDEPASYDDDFFLSLSQMQLFVMPVTTNLLCTENSTLDVEFSFANKNHIPVLPLMQEAGLIALFNQKCGELQYLDKSECDITTASYEEKLEKYLASVLIGDELAERVRAAFGAYVFLSYRKKDRKYAQELMRLIHKNAFCRDIAIWYDEFLTPGENFNDAILSALQKSGLFVLAVTPNLVNEPNYIMSTEYPLAMQEGKPILPAELVPTDHVQLSTKYKNIPTPTNAYNDVELSEALLSSLKRVAIKENDQSPEHNFFIGLAYLSGIDVEINHERGLELITSAAECGLVEAMKKLVTIYHEGIGVKRNILSAIAWQEKVVASYNLKNEAHYTEVIILGKLCLEAGQYQQAKAVFSLLPMLGAKTLQGKLQIAVATYELANIEFDTVVSDADKLSVSQINPGTNKEAMRLYEESLSLFDTIAALDDNISAYKNVIYLRFAEVYYRIGDLLNAQNYLVRVVEDTDFEQIKKDNIQYKVFLDAHFLLGDVMIAQDNTRMAAKHYRLAFDYSENGKIFFGNDYSEKQKGKYYQKLAAMFLKTGDVNNAISNCRNAIEIRLRLAQKLDLHGLWQDVADSNNFIAKVYESQGNMQSAAIYLAEAQSSSARSVKKTDSPQQLEKFAFLTSQYISLAEQGLNRADVLKMTEKQQRDKAACEEKLRLLSLTVQANNNEDTWLEIVKWYRLLAEIYVDIKDYETAAYVYAKAVEIIEPRHEEFSSLKMLGLLSRLYIQIGNMYSNLFRLNTSMDYKIKGARILETIQKWFHKGTSTLSACDSHKTDEAIEEITNSAKAGYILAVEWLVSSYRTGNHVQKDLEQAIYWQKVYCGRLLENFTYKKSLDNLERYADATKTLASLQEESGNTASAIRYYQFALELYEMILPDYRSETTKKQLSTLQIVIEKLKSR